MDHMEMLDSVFDEQEWSAKQWALVSGDVS